MLFIQESRHIEQSPMMCCDSSICFLC